MDTIARLSQSLTGRYQIEREIGRGGMATVYLAQDLRHERRVALKVLDPELGAVLGAERFLAEIRVTANLQHPNLLPLFDSGEADGLLFYVMPFVEGESLRARLDREKQLGVDEAVRMAVAVAKALDYAHAHGVIHRDLKPENILLQAGEPVVADFGIALAVSKAGGARITQTGLSLGTPQYMSPEQATGDRVIDGRTDQYSLAAMLYEMLTGEPPHIGTSAQAIIAKLMTEAPRPATVLRPTVPPGVNAALARALAKLPADRFESTLAFAQALEARDTMGTAASTAGWAAPAAAPAPRRSPLVGVLAATTLLAAGVAGWALTRGGSDAAAGPLQLYLQFPDSMGPVPGSGFAVSPDGRMLAFAGPVAGGLQVWIKARDRMRPQPLAGTGPFAGLGAFAFSPDAQQLAYVAQGKLRTIPLMGGASTVLADTASPSRGLAWLPGGEIAYLRDGGSELRVVPAAGGTARTVWKSDSGSLAAVTAVPGRDLVLLSRCQGQLCSRELSLWAVNTTTGARTRLLEDVLRAWALPSGHLALLRRDGSLYGIRFDASGPSVSGDPVLVQDSVAFNNNNALVTVGANGTLLMRHGGSEIRLPSYTLMWVDRTGAVTPVDTAWKFHLTVSGANIGWSLSPDGQRVAIGLNTNSGDDIWIKQLPAGPLQRLTFDSAAEVRPRWSRDGRSVSFTWWNSSVTSGGNSVQALLRRAADGTGGDSVLVPKRPNGVFEHAFSPDGEYLVVRMGGTVNVVGGRDISVIRPRADTTPRPLLASSSFDEAAFALSPDGKWIAFESNETGTVEVYVRPFPNVDGGKWQVSTGGGRAPLWNRNGRELFFVNAGREMMVAPLTPAGGAPGIGARTVLFPFKPEWYLAARENYTPYDVSPDGKRFLMARAVEVGQTRAGPILYGEGWGAMLARKLDRK